MWHTRRSRATRLVTNTDIVIKRLEHEFVFTRLVRLKPCVEIKKHDGHTCQLLTILDVMR